MNPQAPLPVVQTYPPQQYQHIAAQPQMSAQPPPMQAQPSMQQQQQQPPPQPPPQTQTQQQFAMAPQQPVQIPMPQQQAQQQLPQPPPSQQQPAMPPQATMPIQGPVAQHQVTPHMPQNPMQPPPPSLQVQQQQQQHQQQQQIQQQPQQPPQTQQPPPQQQSQQPPTPQQQQQQQQQPQQQQPSQHSASSHGPAAQATQPTHHQVANQQQQQQQQQQASSKKKRKTADKIIPSKVRELVPESQAYMDLLTFERKLDFTITRKRLDIQEALKRPMKQKRRLRIFITNTFFPVRSDPTTNEEVGVPSWELRVEGRLLDDPAKSSRSDQNRMKKKFSSFFKSLVIELDNQLYGPDNHLVEWHRTPSTTETDGFQVKRPGDRNVKCTILLLLDHQPHQFKLDPRLARLLGKQTDTRPAVINALWQYIKTNKLQDAHEREFINCDKYLEQIFQCQRMKFSEIPSRISRLLNPPDPIIINHVIQNDLQNPRMTSVFDIDVEVDDQLKIQMNNFMMSTANIHEIQSLDSKIYETVEAINQLKTNREFFLGFAEDPQRFTNKWLISQMQDLKLMTDQVGNPEEERRSDYFFQPWTQEAVCRYFYRKVQQRRAELEHSLTSRI